MAIITLTDLRQALRDYTAVGSTILTDAIVDECVNTALRDLLRSHAWRGQEYSMEFTYTAGQEAEALPGDFVVEKALSDKTVLTSAPSDRNRTIPRITRWRWLEGNPAIISRDPVFPQLADPSATPTLIDRAYYLWQDYLYVVPTPTVALTLTLDYYRLLPDLSTDQPTNAFTRLYPEVLRFGALANAYQFLHEEERAALWTQLYIGARDRAIRHDQQIATGNGPYDRGA